MGISRLIEWFLLLGMMVVLAIMIYGVNTYIGSFLLLPKF